MEICSDGHDEVCYETAKCPTCLAYEDDKVLGAMKEILYHIHKKCPMCDFVSEIRSFNKNMKDVGVFCPICDINLITIPCICK